jgi:hypothetical protein
LTHRQTDRRTNTHTYIHPTPLTTFAHGDTRYPTPFAFVVALRVELTVDLTVTSQPCARAAFRPTAETEAETEAARPNIGSSAQCLTVSVISSECSAARFLLQSHHTSNKRNVKQARVTINITHLSNSNKRRLSWSSLIRLCMQSMNTRNTLRPSGCRS